MWETGLLSPQKFPALTPYSALVASDVSLANLIRIRKTSDCFAATCALIRGVSLWRSASLGISVCVMGWNTSKAERFSTWTELFKLMLWFALWWNNTALVGTFFCDVNFLKFDLEKSFIVHAFETETKQKMDWVVYWQLLNYCVKVALDSVSPDLDTLSLEEYIPNCYLAQYKQVKICHLVHRLDRGLRYDWVNQGMRYVLAVKKRLLWVQLNWFPSHLRSASIIFIGQVPTRFADVDSVISESNNNNRAGIEARGSMSRWIGTDETITMTSHAASKLSPRCWTWSKQQVCTDV